MDFGANLRDSWLVVGDLNCNLKLEDKSEGTVPSQYDIRDFMECCQSLNLEDIQSFGCKFSWTNNSITRPVWSNRALGNDSWLQSVIRYQANFLPSGKGVRNIKRRRDWN